MKILITGGHITPALAVADKLLQHTDIELVFVGRKYSTEGEDVSMEFKELNRRNVHFIHLSTGRLTRIASVKSLLNLLKIIPGVINSFRILQQEKPNLVLSFGGYIALPVSIAAYLRGIPVYTHEQTISPGLTNKLIAYFCKKIFISFDETKHNFKGRKTVLTGNPVRESIYKVIKKSFDLERELPVIYITGGSLGAHSINTHIETILQPLLEKYIVVHQVGNVKEYDDLSRLETLSKTFPDLLQNRYCVVEHIMEDELGYILQKADLVIGRSGANTFFELLSLEKPAIFIPLPWSANGEQQKHAEIFENAGCGKIFYQNEGSQALLKMINDIVENKEQYKKNFHKLKKLYKDNAAEEIVRHLLSSS